MPGGILIDVAYVGSRGVHLNKSGENQLNLEQLTPAAIALGSKLQQSVANPFYGIITTGPESTATIPLYYLLAPFPQFTTVQASYPTGGYSSYNAIQLKVEKRMSHGLTALLSFTGQKSIDDFSQISNVGNQAGGIQNIYDDQQQRGVSSNDRSRRLVISGTYELPFGRGKTFGKNWNRPVDAVIGEWQVNGIYTYQTGFPISVTAANNCTGCGIQTLRPNNNGNSAELSGPVSSGSPNTSILPYSRSPPLSPLAVRDELFRMCAPRRVRTSIFALQEFQADRAPHRRISSRSLQLAKPGGLRCPGVGINSNTFGIISSQANSARNIQFGLKLLF